MWKYDFVHKLSTLRGPANTFLFSIDVESLYNIETDRGSLDVRSIFQSSPRDDRPDAEILELLKIKNFGQEQFRNQ